MQDEACCTCARSLASITPVYDEKTEKPAGQDRRLDCCNRIVCSSCIIRNQRFATYCPFCQISIGPSALPQSLHNPPAYSPPPSPGRPALGGTDPPAYSTIDPLTPPREKNSQDQPAEDVLHFLDPSKDTIPSLGLRYGVPQDALRRKNSLFADHLLAARKTVLIPGEFYKGGVSLSPQPIHGEEEEIRRGKIRRFMTSCKVSNYDVAVLYLEQSKQNLDMAVEAYWADEKWEAEHPMEGASKGKGKRPVPRRKLGTGTGLMGQL